MAGRKLWAVGEDMLQADFQGYVADQIVAVFADTTARDAQWPSPPNGAMCYLTGTGAIQHRVGSTWYTPLAQLGYQDRQTNTAGVTTETAISVSVSVTVPSGRRVRLETGFYGTNQVTGGPAIIRIKEGAAVITSAQVSPSAGAGTGGMFGKTVLPTVGSHTYSLTLEGVGGAAFIYAGSGYPGPCWLEARDIGAQ